MSLYQQFEVRFSSTAMADMERLFEFFVEAAKTVDDLVFAESAIGEIQAVCSGSLSKSPFSFRKCGASSLRRELIIPLGATGYVAQYEIEPALSRVIVLAVRHQREDDYH